MDGQALKISSLGDALDFLASDNDNYNDISFEGWPKLDIKIHGKNYNGDITPELAKGIYDLSVCLRKAYSEYKYGTSDLRGRRKQEDQEIFDELLFSIGEGCTGISAWLSKSATKMALDLGKEMISKMDSKDVAKCAMTLIVVFALGYDLHYGIEKYYAAQAQVNQGDAISSALAENRRTVESVLAGLPEIQLSRLHAAERQVRQGHEKIIKSAPDADKIEIGEVEYSKGDIQRINSGESKTTDSEEIKDDVVLVTGIEKNPSTLDVIVKIHSDRFPDKPIKIRYGMGYLDTSSEQNLHKAIEKSPHVKVKISYHAIFNVDGHEFERGILTKVGDIVPIKPNSQEEGSE